MLMDKMPHRSWKGRVFIATSLDGFIARPDGDILWLTDPSPRPPSQQHVPPTSPDKRTVDSIEQNMQRIECIAMGRKTYEKIASFGEWPYTKRTFVISSTLAAGGMELPPSVQVVRSVDEAAEVFERENMKLVYVDGGLVIQEFLRRGWVDEMVVTHAPVLLGRGIPLFGGLEKDVELTLLGVDVIEDGMISTWYQVVH